MSPFKAYLIDQKDGKTVAGFTQFNEDQFDKGEVTIKVAYSSVNYKDALAATGAGRIIRRWFKHCREYNACSVPVFFVKESWYKKVYRPAYDGDSGKSTARPAIIVPGY